MKTTHYVFIGEIEHTDDGAKPGRVLGNASFQYQRGPSLDEDMIRYGLPAIELLLLKLRKATEHDANRH